jgi:hypothetical protein
MDSVLPSFAPLGYTSRENWELSAIMPVYSFAKIANRGWIPLGVCTNLIFSVCFRVFG